jgi:hypothetical protein
MSKNSDMYIRVLLSIVLLFVNYLSYAQSETSTNRLTPKEFAIPASPVFDLMGVTPSQINRTSDIKDFKVDWSFKSWRLNPNIAIQSQPFWEILYNRQDLSKYQRANKFLRKLASLDLSVGSVQDENNDRRLGFALKMNLIRQKDPLMSKDLYEDIGERYSNEKKDLTIKLKELRIQLDSTKKLLSKPDLRNQIDSTEQQLLTLNSRRNSEINDRAKIFISENWNASSLDIAYGRVYTYQTDSIGSLNSLRLNRNTGLGGWINGSLGIGKRILLSGLIRSTWYEEQLDFLIRNTSTGEELTRQAVADNTLITLGFNIRYGGPLFTFFAEFLYEKKGLKTPLEALNQAFSAPTNFTVVGNSVKWNVLNPNTLSFGGDWRLNRSVIINYGMRCIFNKDWKFTTFSPIVTLACMMR